MGQTLHWCQSVNRYDSHLAWWKLSSSLREQSQDQNIHESSFKSLPATESGMEKGHPEWLGNVELKDILFIFPVLASWLISQLSKKIYEQH